MYDENRFNKKKDKKVWLGNCKNGLSNVPAYRSTMCVCIFVLMYLNDLVHTAFMLNVLK